MTEPKPDLTKSVVGKMIDAEKAEIVAQFAQLRAEQKARDERPSVALRAVGAMERLDFTVQYPKTSVLIGVALIVGSLVANGYGKVAAVPMYVLWGIAVCFIPGLAMKIVRLATGLGKAKKESQ